MNYRKAILLYAYAIPVGLALLLAVALLLAPAKFNASQQGKMSDYLAYTNLNQQASSMDAKMSSKRELVAAWRAALENESGATLNELLQSHFKTLDGKQLEQTSTGRPSGGSGLTVSGGQAASRLQLEFRGGFEPMQTTLLVMESKLPQLQMESMEITPDPGGDGLKFGFVYTAWEKAIAR